MSISGNKKLSITGQLLTAIFNSIESNRFYYRLHVLFLIKLAAFHWYRYEILKNYQSQVNY